MSCLFLVIDATHLDCLHGQFLWLNQLAARWHFIAKGLKIEGKSESRSLVTIDNQLTFRLSSFYWLADLTSEFYFIIYDELNWNNVNQLSTDETKQMNGIIQEIWTFFSLHITSILEIFGTYIRLHVLIIFQCSDQAVQNYKNN